VSWTWELYRLKLWFRNILANRWAEGKGRTPHLSNKAQAVQKLHKISASLKHAQMGKVFP